MIALPRAPSAPSRPGHLSGRAVVLFHSHPDDEAIFTGGAARALADAGARVVLVTATLGDLGMSKVVLRRGESLARRRVAELEQAAEILGIARLVVLGHRDSGLPGWATNNHPRALLRADPARVARQVCDVALAEGAEALVHYDPDGIYRHPDHLAVHRIGRAAAQAARVTGYECTLDRGHLARLAEDGHVVQAAARSTEFALVGRSSAEIAVRVTLGASELATKRAAMAAHASQVGPAVVDAPSFPHAYRYEWFLRNGAATLIDEIAADTLGEVPSVHRLDRQPATAQSPGSEVVPHDP